MTVPIAQRMRVHSGMIVALVCALALTAAQLRGAFAGLDRRIADARYQLRPAASASEEIVLVTIDDTTIQEFDRAWPLPRNLYALLLHVLTRAGAVAIGVDILFIGAGPDPKHDQLLAAMTADNPRIVHAIHFPEPSEAGDIALPSPTDLRLLERHGLPDTVHDLPTARMVALPVTPLLESATALGHTDVTLDPDGTVRGLPYFFEFAGRVYPALSVRLVSVARGGTQLPAVEQDGNTVTVDWPDGTRTRLPVDADGMTPIVFAGDRAAFPQQYSMSEVLQRFNAGDEKALADAFGGRIVLIGTTAEQEVATDLGSTPLATLTPLVYVHANAVNALLENTFVRRVPVAIRIVIMVIAAALLGWAFSALPLPGAAGVMVAGVAAIVGLDWLLFQVGALDVPATAFLLLPPTSYAAIASYRFVFLERRTREREKELETARTIQKRLLPDAPPQIDKLDLFGTNIPAREVGGDYFDFLKLEEGRLAVALADVSGKGVPAALLMSHVQASLHAQARERRSPAGVASGVDSLLFQSTKAGHYATFFLAAVDVESRMLHYCNAGHNAGYLVHDGSVEALESTSAPVGLFEGTEFVHSERPFDSGDLLVLYSDGITEAMHKGEFFGDERLLRLLEDLTRGRMTARAVGEAIVDAVQSFTRGDLSDDDVTVVVVRRI